MSQTHPDILKRIQEVKDNGLDTLDLSYGTTGIRLYRIPPELFQLKHLQQLTLRSNYLAHLPEGLEQLTNLTSLDLRSNDLTKLPEGLGQLTDLTSLLLGSNNLTSLPEKLGQLTNLTFLDLSANNLTNLPEELGQLTNLTSLDLRDNTLTSLPEELTQFSNLTYFDLSYNTLTTLPEGLGQLSNLTSLNLSDNKLTSLPEELGQLTNLTSLNLRDNDLTSLPEGLTQLTNLTSLLLGSNKLTDLPEGLCQLTNLAILDLSANNLTSLPEGLGQLTNLTSLNLRDNDLTSLPEGLGQLSNLTSLYLGYNNPIEFPPLEALDLKGSFGKTNIENLRNYFRQLHEEGVEKLYEAKLLIIGQAGAGKTTMAKKINNPDYQLAHDEATTEGIDVIEWGFTMENNQPFRVNIWDFGGQEIYHATHQFFLTKRSLYTLVADTRKEDTDFHYWFNAVELFGDNSPLLVIKNEKQDRQFDINERELRGQFTHFKETLTTNPATNRGLENVLTNIKHYIAHLPHVGDTLPKTWVNVRQSLENDPRDYISLESYLEICDQNGFKRLEDKLQLSDYLHDLGICLHFQNDPLLKKTVILKPQWGTDAVYRVLDNTQVINNRGRFTQADLAKIWQEEKYATKHDELLQLMVNFQLCYEIPNSPGEYIAPQLLTKNQPDYVWDERDNLILRYTYDFMPKGILPRLIVVMHPFIANQEYVWRSGVVLFAKDITVAEVIEYYHQREIRIRLVGPQKRDLLTIITYELDKIHDSFNRLKYSKLIPCNCEQCKGSQSPHFYKYESLRTRLAKKRYEVECDKSYEMVDVLGLIDDIDAGESLKRASEVEDVIISESGGRTVHVNIDLSDNKNIDQSRNKVEKMTEQNKTINIGAGANIEAPVTIADDIQNSFNTLQQSSADDDVKKLLEQLLKAVTEVNKQVPPDMAEDAEAMVRDAKALIEEATSSKPRRKWYEVSAEGLQQAAKNIGKVADPVVDIVKKLLPLLLAVA